MDHENPLSLHGERGEREGTEGDRTDRERFPQMGRYPPSDQGFSPKILHIIEDVEYTAYSVSYVTIGDVKNQTPEPVSLARYRGRVEETGQAVTMDVPRRRKRKKGWRDSVSLVDNNLMAKLELTGSEWRVLHALMAAVPEKSGSTAYVTQQEVADRTGMTQQAVSRAMKELRGRRIIGQLPQRGRWRVSAWIAYNGDFDSWNADVENDPEPIWMRGVDASTGEVS